MKIVFVALSVLLCACVAFYLLFGHLLHPGQSLRIFTYRGDFFRESIVAEVIRIFRDEYSEPLNITTTTFDYSATTDDADLFSLKPGRPALVLLTPGVRPLPQGLALTMAFPGTADSEYIKQNLPAAAFVTYGGRPEMFISVLTRNILLPAEQISGTAEYPALCRSYAYTGSAQYMRDHPFPLPNGQRVLLLPCEGRTQSHYSRIVNTAYENAAGVVADRIGHPTPGLLGTISPDPIAIGKALASFILAYRSGRSPSGQSSEVSILVEKFDAEAAQKLNIPLRPK